MCACVCWIDGGAYEDVGLERDIGEEGEITINYHAQKETTLCVETEIK